MGNTNTIHTDSSDSSESEPSLSSSEMDGGETSGAAIGCGADFNSLPEGCVAYIVSLTCPRDACRFAAVSPLFRTAADSDAVWDRFLPSDHRSILSRAVDSSPRRVFQRKKDLYLSLCDHPLLVDGGDKSFSVDKLSGKKCFMISSRALHIIWGDTPTYWKWTSKPESRFQEVAELLSVCWLDICGKMNTSQLSPNTTYAAYLVYKLTSEAYGFDYHPTEVSVGLAGEESPSHTICLEPAPADQRQQNPFIPRRFWIFGQDRMDGLRRPQQRADDGWLEVELGEYYNNGSGGEGEDGELEMRVMEVKGGNWKKGLIVEGIEIRPKETE